MKVITASDASAAERVQLDESITKALKKERSKGTDCPVVTGWKVEREEAA